MDAYDEVLNRLDGVKHSGQSAMALCPVHEDSKPSLKIGRGTSQPVMVHCFAGCDPVDILAKINLTWDDLCTPREEQPSGDSRFVAEYEYRDEHKRPLYQVCRTADKKFLQRAIDRAGGWRWGLGKARRVLYRLPEVIDAVAAGELIYVCEGEKDVNALVARGVQATCNPGGTGGGWREEYSEALRGAVVIIIADKDTAGQKHARRVLASLRDVAAAVEICEAAAGKDVSDHLSAGYGLSDLVLTCQGDDFKPDLAPTLREFLGIVEPPQQWVIPGMIERGDRLIWTGYEGVGKSWIVRQIAVCASRGIHPFTGELFAPQRVLYIDCENPERLSRRSFRRLDRVATGKGRPDTDMLRVKHIPAGLDLSREDDAAWLCERVMAHQPDLLTIGPFYRLHSCDTNDETAARAVVAALDSARLKSGCALITEHHPGHGDPGNRSLRPTGSSLLMRWPELGYGIKPRGEADDSDHFRELQILSWRPPRDERSWPHALVWGADNDWPWVPYVPALMNGHGPRPVLTGTGADWRTRDDD